VAKEDYVAEINNYPALVDAIWKIVQGTPEDRERVDFMFYELRIAEDLVNDLKVRTKKLD
jgi:hypothetical protein